MLNFIPNLNLKMTVDRSKRRSLLAFIFITKSITKNLLILINIPCRKRSKMAQSDRSYAGRIYFHDRSPRGAFLSTEPALSFWSADGNRKSNVSRFLSHMRTFKEQTHGLKIEDMGKSHGWCSRARMLALLIFNFSVCVFEAKH